MRSVNNKWKKYKVKENRKGTRYRNRDTLKPRMKNWTKMACRTKWRVFFHKILHTPKMYLQSGKKILKFILWKNYEIDLSHHLLHHTDSKTAINGTGQEVIWAQTPWINLIIWEQEKTIIVHNTIFCCIQMKCIQKSVCMADALIVPWNSLEQKACFRNRLTSYWILSQ